MTVSTAGAGAGVVTSDPAGLVCGETCSADFAEGTVVKLEATQAAGSTFTEWSGACSGPGTCEVRMDAPRSVTATFAPAWHELSVAIVENGSVTADAGGLACPEGTCSASYEHGTLVTLTATSNLKNWSGACSGTSRQCQVTMDAAASVTASFKN